MITEDYVSFEVAKLLKERGFNEPFYFFYRTDDRIIHHVVRAKPLIYDNTIDDEVISAPTLQMVMKWLRDVHNLAIVVTPSMFWGKYEVSIYQKGNEYPYGFDGDSFIPSYEEACEAAIKYCLENLI